MKHSKELVIPSFFLAFMLLLNQGCDPKIQLPLKKFDDTIINHTYTPKWGTGLGFHAIYCIYGKTPSGLSAGEAVDFKERFRFRIKEALDKFPELQSKEALKAEEKQEHEPANSH